MNRTSLIVLVAVGLVGLTACRPKYLIHDGFFAEDKLAHHVVEVGGSTGGENSQQLYNYMIEVCDVTATGATNCKNTLILTNLLNY